MKLSIKAAVLLWWRRPPLAWYKPKEGWLRWLLWGREVYEVMDPVIKGSCNDGCAAPEWALTVKVRSF